LKAEYIDDKLILTQRKFTYLPPNYDDANNQEISDGIKWFIPLMYRTANEHLKVELKDQVTSIEVKLDE